MGYANGAAIYGVWIMLLQIAANCPARGVIANDQGQPLDTEQIAWRLGVGTDIVVETITVLTQKEIGWIAVEEDGPQSPEKIDSQLAKIDPKTLEPAYVFPCLRTNKDGPEITYTVTKGDIAEYASVYSAVNVETEIGKALLWIKANRSNRKTKNGMPRFLTLWLSRAHDRQHPRGRNERVPGAAEKFNTPNTESW